VSQKNGLTHRRLAAALLGAAVLLCWVMPAAAGDEASLRETKRASLKLKALDSGRQHFRLLVIPVDFTDARLSSAWDPADLSAELAGEDETLERYFDVASNGILDLRTLLAPVVHLSGSRRDYSDLELNGQHRSRAMAREAIEATAVVLPLRLADGDGPDGLAASGDDDGEVDGVLLLHAGVGLENDPENGLIIPLQSWLEEPVDDHGTIAQAYAMASLGSGLGLWLHETAHLLGLEDRYDLHLSPVTGDAFGRGGLGRFSLMGSGHRGRGDGSGASLLDPYSRLELGWDVVLDPTLHGAVLELSARPLRIDRLGGDGREYFLCEARGGRDHPFDAGVPGDRMLVYHIDESVPEDGQSSSNPETRHLRVRLVEADGDGTIALGLDQGAADDLFPTDGQSQTWTVEGYRDSFAKVLSGIQPVTEGVQALFESVGGHWSSALRFDIQEGDTTLALTVATSDPDLDQAWIRISVLDDTGIWDGGAAIDLELHEVAGMLKPLAAPVWHPALDLAIGSTTRFSARLISPVSAELAPMSWTWGGREPGLIPWPSGWVFPEPTAGSTAWQDWSDAPFSPDGGPLLACLETGQDPADWPLVRTTNNADVVMTSPPIGPGEGFVLLHAVDLPAEDGFFQGDGARLEWVDPAGGIGVLTPAGGYPHRMAPSSSSPLAFEAVFGGGGSLDELDRPIWRLDRFAPPVTTDHYRVNFHLSTDAVWRGRGWLIADWDAIADTAPEPFAPVLEDGVWSWSPHPYAVSPSRVQLSGDGGSHWTTVALVAGTAIDHDVLIEAMKSRGWARADLRALVDLDSGWSLQTRNVDIQAPGAAAAATDLRIWPNPAPDGVRINITLSKTASSGSLTLHDLRGRNLRSWRLGPGQRIVEWNGKDADGRAIAAGRYLFRLTVGTTTSSRSLTLLP